MPQLNKIIGNRKQKVIIISSNRKLITGNRKQKVIIIIATQQRTGLLCLALMRSAIIYHILLSLDCTVKLFID